ncbi:unnamed protein product [Oncorhynchus mykiss]|uniref:Potassium channel tetramerisation-type BTB domain-containing protein n=1 Tax=Oncorhynchus mykiss TaxID=8022 RepID=A0A060Z8W5_ONCMY|nr:unnamed protein product [Oncorhynchus mykiss]
MTDPVTLNVGGCLYTTSQSALQRYPDSLPGGHVPQGLHPPHTTLRDTTSSTEMGPSSATSSTSYAPQSSPCPVTSRRWICCVRLLPDRAVDAVSHRH